ncbi:hypothetical protein [Celeribacter sp.]|uniref:hypothetical protein n=1 Tax=Celeribacter sp. TaxID=1890673 RepID=UPI003A8FC0E5
MNLILRTALLYVAFLFSASASVGENPAPEQPELHFVLSLIDDKCAADGIPKEACSCHRDLFSDKVISKTSNPDLIRTVAMMLAMETLDQNELMAFAQETDPATMQEATHIIFGISLALERCNDQADAEIKAAKAAETAATMPTGSDPRTRFVRQCASQNGKLGLCECIADKMLEQLDPMELDVLVDLKAADAQGKDAMAALAEERGMTVEDAEQALMMMSGRISIAMMSIDPIACAKASQ